MSVLLNLFHNQGRGRPIGRGGGIPWLLRDDFEDTLAAGSVNGTPAVPGPGTRVVVDTTNKLSISGGNLVAVIAGGNSDPGYWLDGIARASGRLMVAELTTGVGNKWAVGFADVNNAYADAGALYFRLNFVRINTNDAAGTIDLIAYSDATSYYCAVVLRTAGEYAYIKGGAFTNWTLLWHTAVDNAATVYPSHAAITAGMAAQSDFIRVPEDTWLPTPLAYDTFTGANGTSLDAHTSNTTGPDSQTVVGRAWTERSGDWDIQSNRANPDGAAIATVAGGLADVVVDCTVNGGAAGQPAICLRYADTSNYWFLQADRANNQFELHEYNATVDTVRANAAVVINDSTDYDLRAICDGQTIDGFLDGANKITYGTAALNETATIHGLYSDNTACQYDGFLIFARDVGYTQLDDYIA